MIARLDGVLESVGEGAALVRVDGGLTYEVLVPSYAEAELAGRVGEPVSLHTLYYLESQNQGATMTPRLAGFVSIEDRRFFELFTTCKGIGNRKALRAMTLGTDQIAAAIADRDVATLQSVGAPPKPSSPRCTVRWISSSAPRHTAESKSPRR